MVSSDGGRVVDGCSWSAPESRSVPLTPRESATKPCWWRRDAAPVVRGVPASSVLFRLYCLGGIPVPLAVGGSGGGELERDRYGSAG